MYMYVYLSGIDNADNMDSAEEAECKVVAVSANLQACRPAFQSLGQVGVARLILSSSGRKMTSGAAVYPTVAGTETVSNAELDGQFLQASQELVSFIASEQLPNESCVAEVLLHRFTTCVLVVLTAV